MISVIVPVYNVERYIDKCIKSIINQTYKDIEIILVNDGSLDNSGKICDYYAIKDKRIKVIHKKNGGLSDARNTGLDVAKGQYIVFLDSDDWVDKYFLEKLYNLSDKYDADIVCCNFKNVYSENEDLHHSNDIKLYSNMEALNYLYTNDGIKMVIAWNKMYKAELFKVNRYPIGKIHEDEFLTPKLIYESKKIVCTEDELIYYRQTDNSITNSKFNKKRLDAIEALVNRRDFFKKNNFIQLYKKNNKKLFFLLIQYHISVRKSNININQKEEILDIIKNYINIIDIKNLNFKSKIILFIFNIYPKALDYVLSFK